MLRVRASAWGGEECGGLRSRSFEVKRACEHHAERAQPSLLEVMAQRLGEWIQRLEGGVRVKGACRQLAECAQASLDVEGSGLKVISPEQVMSPVESQHFFNDAAVSKGGWGV